MLAASANERERAGVDADVRVLGYELKRRKVIRDLQTRQYKPPFIHFNWARAILGAVC
jgi:hypothetical protein